MTARRDEHWLDAVARVLRAETGDLRELAAMAPREASISVSENENPHASNRPLVYALRTGHYDADYVLYRLNTGGFGSDHANKAMATGKYARIAEKEGFALLKRTEPKK